MSQPKVRPTQPDPVECPSAATLGFNFSQSVRLTTRLKEIIRDYPRGLGLLKEFIQNADDAGASHLELVMDWRHHESERLPDPRMSRLMGPALLLANDKPFTEDDLKAIRRIGEGSKTDSAPKTGRFGLGFNTAYNITDYPSFLTGDAIYCFDPHQNAVAQQHGPQQWYGMGWKLSDVWRETPHWPAVFTAGGLSEQAASFSGAIFRLPIRTELTATESEICAEAFTEADFLELVANAEHSGSELLLFTRNLRQLTIRALSPKGDNQVHLRITCLNGDNVAAARAEVFKAMDGTPSVVLGGLSKTSGALPVASYDHWFRLQAAQDRTEAWHVVTGLWRGQHDNLLRAAREMSRLGEKAIPWAAVAARLGDAPRSIRRCKGRLFCTLPLPVDVDIPIHVNGYFDLDLSRQHLSVDPDDQGSPGQALSPWNCALLEDGVASAWAKLLENMATRCADGFYEIWPDVSSSDKALRHLLRNVYTRTVSSPIIAARKADKRTLIQASDLALPSERWRSELHEVLVADGIPQPEPPLPRHVERGYDGVIGTISPQTIRDWLRVSEDVDVVLADAPRPALRRRAWIETLLRFCLSDGKLDEMAGIPLALLCDGKLHTLGFSRHELIFIAGEAQRRLFKEYPYWFFDPEVQKAAALPPIPAVKLHEMSVSNVILRLHIAVGKQSPLPWSRVSAKPPNEKWLAELFDYFSQCEMSPRNLDALSRLPLIPASDGQLHACGTPESPLWSARSDGQKLLAKTLRDIEVPLVELPPAVSTAFMKFIRVHPELLPEITGPRVVLRLHARRERLVLTRAQAEVLLDFLAERRWAYDDEAIRKLREIALLPSDNGQMRAIDHGVYLPAGFQPPAVGLKVHLLQHGERWRELYRLMKVPLLDRRRFLDEMLLPSLAALSEADRWSAWAWIKNTFAAQVLNEDQKQLRDLLASVEGVRATDGSLRAARALHDPSSRVILDVLGKATLYPDLRAQKDKESWLRFFRDLGLVSNPRPKDLIGAIDRFSAQGLAAEPHLRRVWDHIVGEWEVLSKKTVLDEQQTVLFAAALSRRTWLPPIVKSERLCFCAPAARLHRPRDLYVDVDLVASQAPVLAWYVPKGVAGELGLRRTPPLNVALEHFDCLLSLWEKSEHATVFVDAFEKALERIYRYLSRYSENSRRGDGHEVALTPEEWARIKTYRETPCIWDRHRRRLWPPSHVFSGPVPYFEPLRVSLGGTHRAVFELLGAKSDPTTDDFVDFLYDLQATNRYFSAPDERRKVLSVLRQLANEDVPSDLPLLTRDGRIEAPSALYRDDTPWLRDRLGDLPIADEASPPELMERLLVRRLSKCVREALVSVEEAAMDGTAGRASRRILERLRSSEFISGLIRLVRHHHGMVNVPNMNQIQRLALRAAESVVTEVRLEDGESLGVASTRAYFDPARNTLFFTLTSEARIVPYVARTVQRLLGDLALLDLSSLEHILSCDPEEVDDFLDEDRIPELRVEDLEVVWQTSNAFEEDGAELWHEDESDREEAVQGTYDLEGIKLEENPQNATVGEHPSSPSTRLSYRGEGVDRDLRSRVGSGTGPFRGPSAAGPVSGGPVAGPPPGEAYGRIHVGTDDSPQRSQSPVPADANKPWDVVPDAGPPLQAGTGRSTHERIKAGGALVPVGHDDGIDEVAAEARETALRCALEHEEGAGRKGIRAVENSSYYDIASENPATGEKRYIKVRAISHDWRQRPVQVTQVQLRHAFEQSDHYWLYVVERLAGTPRLHRIKDPAGQIRSFAFDSRWAARGEGRVVAEAPRGGMRVFQGDDPLGDIVAVRGAGELKWITVRTPAGEQRSFKYKPDQHRLEVVNADNGT